jgi:hypothetical protein
MHENEVFQNNIIMSSWKLGTKKQYQTFTKRWFQYCSEEQVNSVRPTLDNILEFLTSLFYTPFIYLTTNGCDPTKCPSHFIPNADNAPLAVLRELYPRPLSNKLVKNVSKVLSYLRKLSPVKYITLKDLTLKLCMLIALTCATRTQYVVVLRSKIPFYNQTTTRPCKDVYTT